MFSVRLFQLVIISIIVGLTAPLSAQVGQDTDLWTWSPQAAHHESIMEVELDGAIGAGVIIFVDREKPIADGFQGWCLTAAHVVADDNGRREIRVRYRNGRAAKKCKVLASDEENDVALLWVWVPDTVSPIKVATSPVLPGEKIEIAGLGGGSALACCLRHFDTSAAITTNSMKIYADVALLPGDSGGPVFNDRAEVVGVVSGGWFWWDGRVVNDDGYPVRATWPARTSNLQSLLALIDTVEKKALQFASR